MRNRRFARYLRDTGDGGGGGGQGGQGQNQGGQGGQQGGGQGGAGGGGGQGGTGLLDGLANDQGQQGGNSGGQTGAVTMEQVQQLVTQAAGTAAQSAVDAAINRMNNDGSGRRGRRNGSARRRARSGGTNQGGQNQHDDDDDLDDFDEEPPVDVAGQREGRSLAREYLGDTLRFVDQSERAVANRLILAATSSWDGRGDADAMARRVAQEVGTEMRALRNRYEELILGQLRRAGRLVDQGQNGQGFPGAGSQAAGFPTTPRDARELATTAAKSFAAEYNRSQGRGTTDETGQQMANAGGNR
jgi:hypothetical protein